MPWHEVELKRRKFFQCLLLRYIVRIFSEFIRINTARYLAFSKVNRPFFSTFRESIPEGMLPIFPNTGPTKLALYGLIWWVSLLGSISNRSIYEHVQLELNPARNFSNCFR